MGWVQVALASTATIYMLHTMTSSVASASRQQKLYVLAQAVGWGAFTSVYITLAHLTKGIRLVDMCLFIATNLVGLLLSHFLRGVMNRSGWKQLGWPSLLPRVITATVVIALIWTLLTWPIDYYLGTRDMQLPEISQTAILTYSVMNGIWVFSLWLLLYFGYHTADRFRRSELERAQLQTTLKEAELRALKSQVNPHFIFNALNSLRALIQEDPPRARQAVTQLANLLRYSLQSGQLETVPFEDELRVVNDYLALEQVRHEERLRLKLDVDPAALRCAVPPMLLQTLVENAVKYGIAKLPEGGEIGIAAYWQDECLFLRVTNPGTLGRHPKTEASTGVGLRNAAERLRLLCGEKASLRLAADEPGLVVAAACIPQVMAKVAEPLPV